MKDIQDNELQVGNVVRFVAEVREGDFQGIVTGFETRDDGVEVAIIEGYDNADEPIKVHAFEDEVYKLDVPWARKGVNC